MKQRAFAAALLVFASVIPVSAAEPSLDNPKVLEALRWGMARLERKEYKAAASEFRRASKLAGGPCGPCLLGLARAYTGTRDWDKAIEAARAAIPLTDRPDAQAQAWNQLGVALFQGKQSLAEAEAAFRKALELGGPEASVLTNLAEVLQRTGRHAEALDLARQALGAASGKEDRAGTRAVLCRVKNVVDPPAAAPPASPPEGRCGPRKESEPGGIRLASGAPVPEGKEVTRPEKISGSPPRVPPGLRGTRRGVSVLSAVIDEEGCVRDLLVCEGELEAFNEASREAIRAWVFEPATLDGAPVAVYYTLTTTFQIGIP